MSQIRRSGPRQGRPDTEHHLSARIPAAAGNRQGTGANAQDPPVTRAAVEALAATLVPGEPLPRWARHPSDETQFTAALIGRTDGAFRDVHVVRWDGDECWLSIRVKEATNRG